MLKLFLLMNISSMFDESRSKTHHSPLGFPFKLSMAACSSEAQMVEDLGISVPLWNDVPCPHWSKLEIGDSLPGCLASCRSSVFSCGSCFFGHGGHDMDQLRNCDERWWKYMKVMLSPQFKDDPSCHLERNLYILTKGAIWMIERFSWRSFPHPESGCTRVMHWSLTLWVMHPMGPWGSVTNRYDWCQRGSVKHALTHRHWKINMISSVRNQWTIFQMAPNCQRLWWKQAYHIGSNT